MKLIDCSSCPEKVDDKVDLIEGVTCHTCPLGLEYDHEQPIDE